jgi:hypothetical protein
LYLTRIVRATAEGLAVPVGHPEVVVVVGVVAAAAVVPPDVWVAAMVAC